MTDVFTPELAFGPVQSGIETPTIPGKPYRTIQASGGTVIPLSFNFAGAIYSVAGINYGSLSLVPGYAYSRAGAKAEPTATGVSSPFAANTPAIVSGLGYYSEATFTNRLLQSQSFDNATWIKNGVTVTADSTTAPDGTSTADSIVIPSTASSIFISQAYTTAVGAAVVSVYAKAGTQAILQICDDGNSGTAGTNFCNFDLTNGVVGSSSGLTGSIQAVGNGWYRCSVSYTSTGTATTCYFVMVSLATSGRGDAVSPGTLFLWQAQSVAAAVPGPPIITTTGTVTVAADSLAVTVPNGTYTATYTFSDNSTQTISTTISGTTFTLPLYPATLSKLPITSVIFS